MSHKPYSEDTEDSTMSAVSSEHPPAPLSRAISGKSRLAAAGETTPLMLDVPGHFRDLPMFLDTAQRLRSGRWKAMVEAIVSKVFWDGFFWERGAYIALQFGHGDSTFLYFFLSGLGAAFGVFLGQWLYGVIWYLIAALRAYDRGHEVPTPKIILMVSEGAILLSSGAFVSGFMWQPVVNVLMLLIPPPGEGVPSFTILLLLTGVIEGFVFFMGLHLFRFLYNTLLKWEGVDAPLTEGAFEYDMTLSLSIGGAAGLFVATEAYYSKNLLTDWFGVYKDTPVAQGCFLAGMSMVVGFAIAQSVQNLVMPTNTSWADQRHKGQKQMRDTGTDRPLTESGAPEPYIPPHG